MQDALPGGSSFNDEDRRFDVGVTDSRRAMAYLVAPGSDEYIRIMTEESGALEPAAIEVAGLGDGMTS